MIISLKYVARYFIFKIIFLGFNTAYVLTRISVPETARPGYVLLREVNSDFYEQIDKIETIPKIEPTPVDYNLELGG